MRREAPTISVLRLVVGTSLSYSKATYGRSHSRARPKGVIAPNIKFLEYETVLILMRVGVILKEDKK